jgi:uncharacterized membrane protein YhaH (DUF805 family)
MLSNFFGFSGRIGRGIWWLGQLVIVMILGAAFVVAHQFITPGEDPEQSDVFAVLGPLGIGYLLAVVINVSTSVKRYHDRGKSGFWFFIVVVPFIGGIWQLIELGFYSGDDGDNQYGPPPGSARRAESLRQEVGGMASSSFAAKLDDDYLQNYAKQYAMNQANPPSTQQRTSGQFSSGPAKPVFGKR